MRFWWFAAASVIGFAPGLARADECPEGDWFCEPAPETSADASPDATPEAAPGSENAAKAGGDKADGPPLVVYTPPGEKQPSRIIVVEQPAPKPPPKPRPRRWGFDLHLAGAILGDDRHRDKDAGMGGLGFGFRFRPAPVVALVADLELLGGTDFNGFERHENAFLGNVLLFFNPRDQFQVYWVGGFGASGAQVTVEPRGEETFSAYETHYSYLGLQTGLGFEAYVSKKVALSLDLLGFVRGRTDRDADENPEFVDADTHRATNASGGGLVRGGVVFTW